MSSVSDPGLCASCANVRIITSGKGSTFLLCELSRVDARFPRYPRLPVLECAGWRPAERPEERLTEGR